VRMPCDYGSRYGIVSHSMMLMLARQWWLQSYHPTCSLSTFPSRNLHSSQISLMLVNTLKEIVGRAFRLLAQID
jgi:hypothetical protein